MSKNAKRSSHVVQKGLRYSLLTAVSLTGLSQSVAFQTDPTGELLSTICPPPRGVVCSNLAEENNGPQSPTPGQSFTVEMYSVSSTASSSLSSITTSGGIA